MSTITKIEIVLGDTAKVWAEIDPTTIHWKHANETIRATARKMWLQDGFAKFARVIVTRGIDKETISL